MALELSEMLAFTTGDRASTVLIRLLVTIGMVSASMATYSLSSNLLTAASAGYGEIALRILCNPRLHRASYFPHLLPVSDIEIQTPLVFSDLSINAPPLRRRRPPFVTDLEGMIYSHILVHLCIYDLLSPTSKNIACSRSSSELSVLSRFATGWVPSCGAQDGAADADASETGHGLLH